MYEHRPTQEDIILNLLRQGKVTSIQLTTEPYFIQQYNARIWGLRRKGHNIKCTIKHAKSGAKYGEYELEKS